jgi:L-ascorbate metabolism protein UlaG (beta-lactamase superfamily)
MPIVRLTKADFAPASGLRATWLGHSTVLVEIDGARILFDPVWARRASPSSLIGPKRFHEPPLALGELPPLDAIVASHDHYDHLDRGVVRALAQSAAQSRARFVVPLGVGAHLERWGVAPDRITELDWSESTKVGPLTLTATPARHFSGRGLNDRNHTLWASWSGPFDLTFIKIGAYGDTWPDIHLTPEQAVDAHAKVRGNLLLPIHWGTFNLAFHAWDEPAERVVVAAAAAGARLVMPKPGESVEPATAPPVKPWWRAVRGNP